MLWSILDLPWCGPGSGGPTLDLQSWELFSNLHRHLEHDFCLHHVEDILAMGPKSNKANPRRAIRRPVQAILDSLRRGQVSVFEVGSPKPGGPRHSTHCRDFLLQKYDPKLWRRLIPQAPPGLKSYQHALRWSHIPNAAI